MRGNLCSLSGRDWPFQAAHRCRRDGTARNMNTVAKLAAMAGE